MMDVSTVKALLDNISYSLRFSSCENLDTEPALKYLQKIEEILQLLKPVLDAIVDSEVASNQLLTKPCEELGSYVDETRELFDSWHQLKSKVFFVLQIESMVLKIQSSSLDILEVLRSLTQSLPEELTPPSLELCLDKIKHSAYEQTSDVIQESVMNQVDSISPSLESLKKIANSLNLKSNQEILIEAVALEKLKENAETENSGEAEYINQMIGLVTHMHDCLILTQQSQSSSPVPIPPDFCCPLSLELMTDPVMVSSGQTYERVFIKNWIDHGLNVCPKTRQTLANTNLIPNYTVKALIANWCESNNVRLPDPVLSMKFPPSSPLHARTESAHRDSHLASQSSGTQQLSPESRHSISSSETDLSLSGELHPGVSHPRSPSRASLSGLVRNGHALDNGRSSQTEVPNPEERNIDSRGQQSPLKSRLEFSDANGGDKNMPHGHNRSTSSSSSLSNVNGSQPMHGDTNDASQTSAKSSDASGEVAMEPPVPNVPSLRRESDPIQRVETRTRNQTIWRRPSDRFAPRIVSSPITETRPDLSAIETQVQEIIVDLNSTSVDIQREATEKLRLLAKHNMDNRIAIANCGAISILVNLLRSADSKIQDNAVTALLNLSINDNNKNLIANAEAIEPLIHVLETGSPEARENSAATLFSLSVMEENKAKIGRAGAIPPLVDLLGNGTPRGKKDAATALFNLSIYHDNKSKILQAGAVKYLVELMDPAAGMVDKAVAVLANLATIQEGRTAIGQGGGIRVLVEVVELGSARGKENAAAALLQLCTNSNRFCSMVLQEGAVPPLVALSQTGTPRAREKALGLLSCFRSHRHGNGGRG